MSTIEERLAAVESELAALKAKVTAAGGVTGGPRKMEPFVPEKLQEAWADKEIRKDPSTWKGESYVGRKMSECPKKYLEAQASFHEYKAYKGRQENPPRCQTNGKPWYEQDEFMAKLFRTWAQIANDEALPF